MVGYSWSQGELVAREHNLGGLHVHDRAGDEQLGGRAVVLYRYWYCYPKCSWWSSAWLSRNYGTEIWDFGSCGFDVFQILYIWYFQSFLVDTIPNDRIRSMRITFLTIVRNVAQILGNLATTAVLTKTIVGHIDWLAFSGCALIVANVCECWVTVECHFCRFTHYGDCRMCSQKTWGKRSQKVDKRWLRNTLVSTFFFLSTFPNFR